MEMAFREIQRKARVLEKSLSKPTAARITSGSAWTERLLRHLFQGISQQQLI